MRLTGQARAAGSQNRYGYRLTWKDFSCDCFRLNCFVIISLLLFLSECMFCFIIVTVMIDVQCFVLSL